MKFLQLYTSVVLLVASSGVSALDFHLEKQKLKLSYEYENYVNLNGSEILTPGLKAGYFMKGTAEAGKKLLLNFDLQTGLKGNLTTHFKLGDLSRLTWTNRAFASATIPWKKFYFGGTLYFRNKWLSEVPLSVRFIDVFGGEGYREITGGLQIGFVPAPRWELSGAFQSSSLQFQHFSLSDSRWKGGQVRIAHKIKDVKVNVGYRYRSIDYDRPVILTSPGVVSLTGALQHDRFWEVGGNIEFYRFVYFSGGYYYQHNSSNSPGFSYDNNRVSVLIGADLRRDLHLQAYGILTMQNYLTRESLLDIPLLLDESENSMAVSLIKSLNEPSEIEMGFMRFTNYSSYRALNVSKNIFYAAYNYRF
jgi:hypothetical protein